MRLNPIPAARPNTNASAALRTRPMNMMTAKGLTDSSIKGAITATTIRIMLYTPGFWQFGALGWSTQSSGFVACPCTSKSSRINSNTAASPTPRVAPLTIARVNRRQLVGQGDFLEKCSRRSPRASIVSVGKIAANAINIAVTGGSVTASPLIWSQYAAPITARYSRKNIQNWGMTKSAEGFLKNTERILWYSPKPPPIRPAQAKPIKSMIDAKYSLALKVE